MTHNLLPNEINGATHVVCPKCGLILPIGLKYTGKDVENKPQLEGLWFCPHCSKNFDPCESVEPKESKFVADPCDNEDLELTTSDLNRI